MRLFGGWLHATERLQLEKYRDDLRELTGEEYAAQVALNVTGLVEELGEYLKETRWKPWKSPRRDPLLAGRRREELVDVLHFVANLCVLEGFTDATLSDAYLDKLRFNLARTDHRSETPPDPEGDIKADIEKARAATCNCNDPKSPIYEVCPVHGEKHFT